MFVKNHDVLLAAYLRAAHLNLLPLPKSETPDSAMTVVTSRGLEFPSPVGLADGIVSEGRGLDGVMDAFGHSPPHGTKGSVQVGPCCPDGL